MIKLEKDVIVRSLYAVSNEVFFVHFWLVLVSLEVVFILKVRCFRDKFE